MKRILGYSTGKDSTPLVLWAREQFDQSEIIVTFDDTIWEHELTYGYLAQMQSGELLRGLRFERLVSKVYPGGTGALVQIKGRVPSANQRELKAYLADPEMAQELKARIYLLEQLCGRSFFQPTYIPERFCAGFDEKTGKRFPWADDVFRYIEATDENQLPMFAPRQCMSVYNRCER